LKQKILSNRAFY